MRDRIVLQYRPRVGARRRIIFEPDPVVEDTAHSYWRIEEVYSTVEEGWRETGREHVTDPDVVVRVRGAPGARRADARDGR